MFSLAQEWRGHERGNLVRMVTASRRAKGGSFHRRRKLLRSRSLKYLHAGFTCFWGSRCIVRQRPFPYSLCIDRSLDLGSSLRQLDNRVVSPEGSAHPRHLYPGPFGGRGCEQFMSVGRFIWFQINALLPQLYFFLFFSFSLTFDGSSVTVGSSCWARHCLMPI